MTKRMITPVSMAASLALAGSLAGISVAQADANPFGMTAMSSGYMTMAALDQHKDKEGEGKCGEGKCGGDKEGEGKCGEGKCGGDKEGEGKCGEGKCGGDKKGEGKCGGDKA